MKAADLSFCVSYGVNHLPKAPPRLVGQLAGTCNEHISTRVQYKYIEGTKKSTTKIDGVGEWLLKEKQGQCNLGATLNIALVTMSISTRDEL
jgi:hypothetical protein